MSTVDFSIVNTDTGAKVMSQGYSGQGNIGLYLPAGSYTIFLHNGSILAGETHTVTLTQLELLTHYAQALEPP